MGLSRVDGEFTIGQLEKQQFEYVVGLVEDAFFMKYLLLGTNTGAVCHIMAGLGLDVVNANAATLTVDVSAAQNTKAYATAILDSYPLLGYHFVQLLEETGVATLTIYGYDAGLIKYSGATGWIFS